MKKYMPVIFSNKLFQGRFGFLLGSLFGLLLMAAFAQNELLTNEFFLLALCLVLIASLYAVELTTHHMKLFIAFGMVAIGGNIIGYFIPGPQADIIAAGLNFLFIGWMIVLLFHFIFTTKMVTLNIIMGAASLYLLFGVMFGFVYMIVDYMVPHSFEIQNQTAFTYSKYGTESLLDHFFYFSFVTLTTVGYGDIAPVSQPARYLAVIEALCAQLYVTILVARLVGMHLNQRSHQDGI